MSNPLDRIVFVPVIHTDRESVDHAREVVRKERPSVVAVELDRERYAQLMNPAEQEDVEVQQPTGDMAQDLVLQLALLEKSLGSITGSDVGEEMMTAIEEGRSIGAKIALVDRPMKETVRSMMQVPLDELYKLFNMLPEASKEIQEGGIGDLFALLKEEGAVDNIMDQFRNEFPNLTRVLIEERDAYVARALHFILNDADGVIVAVLGAGHIQGVRKALVEFLAEES
jgi:pheromone shutdown protein TraB